MKRAARLAPEAARDTAQHTSNGTPVLSSAQEGTALNARPAEAAAVHMIADTKLSRLETVSAPDAVETDTTDETYFVGNGEFLLAVFGDELEDARPVVVSFDGNPASVPAKVWFGRPWQGKPEVSASLPASANNYFSLAVFRPDEAGQFRRQKARFHALYAVMLDDVGTKVAMERLTLPPSWLLETSAGNHQAGYLLREPLTDGTAADRLMNAIVAAGLCDPGANGPRARLARLPVAVNGKHTPPFQCRMVEVVARVALFGRRTGRWPSVGDGIGRATQAAEHAPRAGATG